MTQSNITIYLHNPFRYEQSLNNTNPDDYCLHKPKQVDYKLHQNYITLLKLTLPISSISKANQPMSHEKGLARVFKKQFIHISYSFSEVYIVRYVNIFLITRRNRLLKQYRDLSFSNFSLYRSLVGSLKTCDYNRSRIRISKKIKTNYNLMYTNN